jgi:hypothetical protein
MRARPNSNTTSLRILDIPTSPNKLAKIIKLTRTIRIREDNILAPNMAHAMRHSPTLPPGLGQVHNANRSRRDMHALRNLRRPRSCITLGMERELVIARETEGDFLCAVC